MYIKEVRKIENTKIKLSTVVFNINHNNKIVKGTLTQTMLFITILMIIAIITIIRLHHTIIEPTNKVVTLNDWKVKFKINWDNVFIYKHAGNKYENYVTHVCMGIGYVNYNINNTFVLYMQELACEKSY